MKKIIFAGLMMLLVFMPSAYAMTGSGTGADPYGIENCTDLQDMKNDLAASYVLNNNIDCSKTALWNNGSGFYPIMNFEGNFDGNGNIIRSLYVDTKSGHYGALFGIITGTASVKNVGLMDVHINSSLYTGGIAGRNIGGTIENCFVSGNITGTSQVGGIVGFSQGNVKNCYNTASVTGTDSIRIGGIVGRNSSVIEKSYNKGKITGAAGYTGGGIAGEGTAVNVLNSFWDSATSNAVSSNGGTGKTTLEMKTVGTYSSWDFASIWSMDPAVNEGYPYLKVIPSENFGEFSLSAVQATAGFQPIKIDGTVKTASVSLSDMTVTDERGFQDGWSLSVRANPLTGKNTLYALPSGTLLFSGIDSVTETDGTGNTADALVAGPIGIDGGEMKILSSQAGASTGKFVVSFPADSLQISLNTDGIYSDIYETEIVWILSAGP